MQSEQEQLHHYVFRIAQALRKSPKISEKDQEYFVSQLRFLEHEFDKPEPSPLFVRNTLKDCEESLAFAQEDIVQIKNLPMVKALIKHKTKKSSLIKKMFGSK